MPGDPDHDSAERSLRSATTIGPSDVSDRNGNGTRRSSERTTLRSAALDGERRSRDKTIATVTTVRADPRSPVRVRATESITIRAPRTTKTLRQVPPDETRVPKNRTGARARPLKTATQEQVPQSAAPPRARRQQKQISLSRRRVKPRVRRVTRVVRRVDAWSVFKVSLVFFVAAYAVLVVAGSLLWQVGVSTGAIENVENFIRDLFVQDSFALDGEKILRASWILGAIFVVGATAATTTMAIVFNLICDLVGGIKVLVLEEEVIRRVPVIVPLDEGALGASAGTDGSAPSRPAGDGQSG